MREYFALPALILTAGLFVTFVHEFTYRRTGGDDYELGGLISHAGSDMLITTVACLIAACVWLWGEKRRQ